MVGEEVIFLIESDDLAHTWMHNLQPTKHKVLYLSHFYQVMC